MEKVNKNCQCKKPKRNGQYEVGKFEETIQERELAIIEEIDKVYKKEKGIRNWLDLRDKVLAKIKSKINL